MQSSCILASCPALSLLPVPLSAAPGPSPRPGASGASHGKPGTAASGPARPGPFLSHRSRSRSLPAAGPESAGAIPVDTPAEPAETSPAGGRDGGPDTAIRASEGFLPRLDVYFPEGDLDLRVSRLINKVFFEGQVKYNFVGGDIAAFLRYRYYGYKRTTQFTVFDEVEFQEVQDFSSDFDRTRGTLLLFQWPLSYHYRTFLLTELDRISTNKEDLAEILRRGETNTFVRLGFQIGTPDDVRSNAIVGEQRARQERLFTAFREIGPGQAGFTTALTYGFPYGIGDFDYVKIEAEGLKRFDVSARTFLVGRAHGGTFFDKDIRPLRSSRRIPSRAIFSPSPSGSSSGSTGARTSRGWTCGCGEPRNFIQRGSTSFPGS